jgi:uncharacterized protein YbjT (DUF2867 family)
MTATSTESKSILVTGATGQQGGATARALGKRGFKVRALTRKPTSPSAERLSSEGVEVMAGDLDDRGSLDRALQGVHGVFSVQTFMNGGVEAEERQGKLLADAAKAASVKHFVYSSVGGAERDTRVPHFESKWRIEEHIRAIGLPHTILRPVFFMDNLRPQRIARMIFLGMLHAELGDQTPLQLIAVEDIGEIAAEAFTHPERYLGQAIEIAGDSLTLPEIQQAFQKRTGRPERRLPVPRFLVRMMPKEMSRMLEWFGEGGYAADIQKVRALHPGLKTLEAWLKTAQMG